MTMQVVPGPDGLDRRAFSADEVRRMTEAGILGEDDRVELVDGELLVMSPKGPEHDWIKMAIAERLFRALDPSFYIAVECTLRLDPFTLVEPDIMVCRKAAWRISAEGYAEVPGPEILLLIEVAHSSLAYDRRRKAAMYAAHGLPEYWIVAVGKGQTWVHLDPEPKGYGRVDPVAGSESLKAGAPALAPFEMRLAELMST